MLHYVHPFFVAREREREQPLSIRPISNFGHFAAIEQSRETEKCTMKRGIGRLEERGKKLPPPSSSPGENNEKSERWEREERRGGGWVQNKQGGGGRKMATEKEERRDEE